MIGWRWEIIIEETEKIASTVGGWMLPTASFTSVSLSTRSLATAILNHIQGRVKEIRIIALLDLPANNPSTAADYSEVERKATFVLKASDKYTRFSIPTVTDSNFKPSDIHVTDSFLNDVGGVILAGPFCSSNFQPITQVMKGVKSFGKAQ